MPTKLLFALVLLFISQSNQAQDFSIFTIPKELSKNANAVVRFEEESIELISQDRMIIKIKTGITIFNEQADYMTNLTIYYDKQTSIKNVSMTFYNAFGKQIKKVKKRDFKDYSATGNYSLYTDNRAINYHYTAHTYPYTVYYEYEINSKNTAFIPSWYPIKSPDMGVLKSSYSFSYPKGFSIQKSEINFDKYPIKNNSSIRTISYFVENIPPIKEEFLSPSYHKFIPKLMLASNKFSLAGIKGEANTWEEFGKWMYHNLIGKQNNLSEVTKQKVREMVKGIEDPIERAKIIYEYVQNKTRYISVQVGIGGWQPMLTDDVDKLGYGDCKALTFYTKSLMDVAEIPSFYTAVFSGDNKRNIEKNVVSVQGDHVFLCLPTVKDTIWLECTSQKVPFGYKNSFTDDRDVLVITPQGGKIIHTNTNKATDNLQETVASYTIGNNGEIKGSIKIKSYGTQYLSHLINDGLSPSKLDEKMKDYFEHINNLTFSKIDVLNNKNNMCFEESINFSAEHYAVINPDKSMLLTLNAFNRNNHVPKREKNRKTNFEISRGYKDVDEYVITLPENYKFPILPEAVLFENQFGKYTLTVEKILENQLAYKRTFILNKGLYNKDLYDDYRLFRKKIKKYENLKILLYKH